MDPRFLPHNSHLQYPQQFAKRDPHLQKLSQQRYVYKSPLLEQMPIDISGIYTITGGRQVGKTTLIKQWMAKLLANNIPPQAISFLSGELIEDQHVLLRLLQNQLAEMPTDSMRYLLLDEVTYIRDWDKAIKYAADAGMLNNTELLLTGSDSVIIREARMRFPGRRGKASRVDFHLYPLSFAELVAIKNIAEKDIDALYAEFNNYLMHGGYLTAINDLAENGHITPATFNTYSDWVRGDILKRGKQELYLQEILSAIIKRYGSQITWHSLANDLSIDHHKTVADYVELLSSMDVLFVQYALREDKLAPASKKARKIIFTDPFIFHAIRAWIWPVTDPFQQQVATIIKDENVMAKLVEAAVVSHYRRLYPTYYKDNKFWPLEVKWTNQLRPKDLKQISKYPNSIILSKVSQAGLLQNIKVEPLPLALLRIQ
jgi:predicted AAA+ superfamily ATPase